LKNLNQIDGFDIKEIGVDFGKISFFNKPDEL
jgi:hypothetical protein